MENTFVSASRFADEFASSVDCVSEACFSKPETSCSIRFDGFITLAYFDLICLSLFFVFSV